jgi:hypothetical protein
VIEIGGSNSELVTFDESGPASLRVVGIGGENGSADPLFNALRGNGAVEKIFVSGKAAADWSARISPKTPAEALPAAGGASTAISGLRESLRRGAEPLLIHAKRESIRVQRAPAQWRWAAAACALLLVSVGLRFVEPMVRKARLRSTIAELESRRAKLPKIDREAAFLSYIHSSQPDYLEVIGALAAAAQPGMKLDSLTISRRGEVALRGSAQGAQAPGTLRSKMLDSGYFANVVIDEQTPNQQNQQQVSFRMTAQAVPETERKVAAVSKTKLDKPSTNTNKVSAPTENGHAISASQEVPAPTPGIVVSPPGAVASPPAPPASVNLPPGASLPPGVSLPPGIVVQGGENPQ